MNIIYKPDPNLIIKPEEAIRGPIIITVNKFDEESVRNFRAEMLKAQNTSQSTIPILIDSYGGQIYALKAMIDIIKSSTKPVSTIAIGKAMSCGAVLLSCGSPGLRYATPESSIMVHDVAGGALGKVEEIKVGAKQIEDIQKWFYNFLDKNCNKQSGYFENEIHERSHADWFLTPEDCLVHGLIDKIGMPYFEISTVLKMEFKK